MWESKFTLPIALGFGLCNCLYYRASHDQSFPELDAEILLGLSKI